jgi:hypothetical protein
MEVIDGMEYFKAIPFRIYQNDKSFIQNTFEPTNESGKRRNLGDLLEFIFGADFKQSIRFVLIQGIVLKKAEWNKIFSMIMN